MRPYPIKSFDNGINLIYSGRIVKSKNIDTMIEIVSILKKMGYEVRLTLIGEGATEYTAQLKRYAMDLQINNEIIFTGHIDFDNTIKYLNNAHFFLFPSQEIKEGHSNSLTEAMAFGAVPLVSTAGFSPDIVDNPNLVITEIDAFKYAEKISYILNNDLWLKYSKESFDRVRSFYTESHVSSKIVQAFSSLE